MIRFKLHRQLLAGGLGLSLVAACQPTPVATIQPAATAPGESAPATAALGLSGSANIGGQPFSNADLKVYRPGQAQPIATGKTGPDGRFSLTLANVIAPGGGNVIAPGGGNVIAPGGGNVIAPGGGNVIAPGGGNVIAAGGGNVIAAGGGNLISAGAPLKIVASKEGASLAAIGIAGVIAAGGGNVIAAGGGNVIAAGGGNVIAAGGGNYRVLQAPREVHMSPATTLAVIALGDRLEGALRAATRSDGVAIDSVVAEVLQAFERLTASVSGSLGEGGDAGLLAAVTRALDADGKGNLDAAAQAQLTSLNSEFKAAFLAAADSLGKAITQAIQAGGTAPEPGAEQGLTFGGVEAPSAQIPTTTPTTTNPVSDGVDAPSSSSSSGGDGPTGNGTASNPTLVGNLNPATGESFWQTTFGDFSGFDVLGGFPETAIYGHGTVAVAGYAYMLGGTTDGTTGLSGVVRVTMNPPDGNGVSYAGEATVVSQPQLVEAAYGLAGIELGKRIYAVGGRSGASTPSSSIASVVTASIDLTDFVASTFSLGTARSHHALATASTETGGYLYVIGGRGVTSPTNTVEVAACDTDGVLTSITPSAHALNTARYGHAAFVTHKGEPMVPAYLYVIGGSNGTASLDTVERAPLDANGLLSGPFVVDPTLKLWDAYRNESRGRHGLAIAALNGRLYVLGGLRHENGSERPFDGSDVAPIDPVSGLLGAFKPHHAEANWGRGFYSAVVHDYSNLFLFGGTPGHSGSMPNPNVERAFWR